MSRYGNTDPTPTTYAEADAVLNGRNTRKIGNNTWLERRSDSIVVRLHATDVVTWSPGGDVVFNTGGWNTTTTRDRLNRYAPAGVGFAIRKGEMVWIDQTTWTETPFVDVFTLGLTPAS